MQITTFEKSIRYDRTTRDYAMYLDGELVGFARTYHEAEVSLDQVAFDRLTHGDCATATELDGGAVESPAGIVVLQIPLDPPNEPSPLGEDEGDSVPSLVNWNSATATTAAYPVCRACGTNDYPPSSLVEQLCISCANARYFGLTDRFAAAQRAMREPPAEPMPQDDEDDNWGGWRRPLAITRQSQAIEARLATCGYCQGIHHVQSCPELRASDADWRIALGRELCRMKWRDFKAFVALLLSVPTEHLVIYAASYQAFIRSYRPDSALTINEVLAVWTRDMQRGQSARALGEAA